MNTQDILDPERWAKKTFGSSQLNDIRRTGRAVKAAKRMAENPSATLPAQMQTWKETMALYRLLKEDDVTFEALMQPHWQQTREQIETRPVVLLVQDTTEVDLSHHPKTKGLGQVGNERGRGLYLQTVLAVLPHSGEVLGCAMQEPFVRKPAPIGETRSKRRQRSERETDVWMRQVTRLGSFPAETTAVHVGDRGADMFPFFQACRATQTHFLVRAFENRRIEPEEERHTHLLDEVRAWSATASRPFHVPGSHGRTARSTVVQLAYGALTVLPPRARETLRQRAAEGVGHPCLGRADPRRRRAVGMDSGDLGVHDDAPAGMPSASGGMNTAGSWKTITTVSKPGAVSKSARCRAPSV